MRRLRPDQLVFGLFGALFAVFINVASGWLSVAGRTVLTVFIVVTLAAGIAAVYFIFRRRSDRARLGPPVTLVSPSECRQYARQGLIAFVSLYNPIKATPAERARLLNDWRAAAEALDYERLQLEKSNLEPLIKAVTCHGDRLTHCWLIATSGPGGSEAILPALVNYLKEVKGARCEFHCDITYRVTIGGNDAEVVVKTRDLVERAFEEARELGLQAEHMLADITGGFRSMPLGMILACLDKSRDLEYVGSHYDDAGQLSGEPFPMIFRFEVVAEDRR